MTNEKAIFDFLRDDAKHYVFAVAFVDVRYNKDTDKPFLNTTQWVIQTLGCYDDAHLQDEILNLEPIDYNVTQEGYYEVNVLFSIHADDNGVGHHWNYLEPEQVEFEYAISIEEYEKEISVVKQDISLFDEIYKISHIANIINKKRNNNEKGTKEN